ncbi:unnamed protein product [Mytilus coruscus]|uniref:PHD-type domain-containing protein n=1 Tax=Mytilus coruscus TaxID=42192 RepID=A0A6J8DWJ2_MYTCO|nr:unnamed protein product [Mytilus coruscus]
MDIDGEEFDFSAVDEENVSKLERTPVPQHLHINSIDSKVIASRRQFPSCLAFSITIHKAQGLTLDRVEVDASCIFAPGQLGVAIDQQMNLYQKNYLTSVMLKLIKWTFLLSNEHDELDETESILVEEKFIDMSEITDLFSRETNAPLEQLKSAIFDQGNYAFVNFVKNYLLKLCKAYENKMSSSSSNVVIKQKLCSKIPSLEGVSYPQYLHQTVSDTTIVSTSTESTTATSSESTPSTSTKSSPSTSTGNTSVPQLRRRKRKSKFTTKSKRKSSKTENQEEKKTVCPLCKSIYIVGDDWIACDLCDLWYDRTCLKLNDDQWHELEGSDWYCLVCLK